MAHLDPKVPLPQKEKQPPLHDDPIGRRLTALTIAQDLGLDLPGIDGYLHDLLALITTRSQQVEETIGGERAATDDPFSFIRGMSDPRWLVGLRHNLADAHRAITDAIQNRRAIDFERMALGSINHDRKTAHEWISRQAAADHIEHLIAAGDIALARRLAADIGEHDANFTDADERKVRDLCAAAQAVGLSPDYPSLLGDVSRLRSAYRYATAPARLDESPEPDMTPPHPACATDPAAALTQLHALLRDPRRFLPEERPANHELAVRVEMTADAYRDMYGGLRESPAWSHERIIVDRDRSDPEGRHLIGVATRLRARIGATTVSIDLVSHLASDTEPSRLSGLDLAREAFGDRYASGLHPPDATTDQDPVSWRPAEAAPASPFTSTHHLLGPDRCDHPDATWRLHNNRYTPYLALECPRCLRRRVAVRPALMDITTDEGRERFRNQQVAQQILTGAPRNDDVDALIAAARALPTDPAAYATHIDAAAPTPTVERRRPRTIADAIRRT